jgi:acyl-[acyl-carrier-protein]-phospholipid O-acyltransferase / long-chain-fatty-acid--[acyl-carrier-protein] ligase
MGERSIPVKNEGSLLMAVLRVCRAWRRKEKFVDTTGARLTGGEMLARSFALRRILHRELLQPDERTVGVLLPSTVAGVVTNLALAFDRRVAVNLNFTLSPQLLDACIEKASIRTVLTSRKVVDRLKLHPEAELIFLEDLRDRVTLRDKAVAALMAFVVPLPLLRRRLELDEIEPDDLLTILFTSGSTGDPKGAMLSYRNIASNIKMVLQVLNLQDDEVGSGVSPSSMPSDSPSHSGCRSSAMRKAPSTPVRSKPTSSAGSPEKSRVRSYWRLRRSCASISIVSTRPTLRR